MIINRVASLGFENLANIYIKQKGKTIYNQWDYFDASGYVIYALYLDGTAKDVTAHCTYDLVGELQHSDTIVTFTYIEGNRTVTTTQELTINVKYQPLSYLESTGTQYIDTGFVPTQNTKVEAEIAITDTRTSTNIWPAIFGAQNLANGSDGRTFDLGYTPSTKTMPGSLLYTMGAKYSIALSTEGYYINEKKYSNYTWVDTPTVSMALFTRHSANNGYETCMQAYARIYALKIYENGELIHDYMPFVRTADNVLGMYDKVEEKFLANKGTGTFIGGAKI